MSGMRFSLRALFIITAVAGIVLWACMKRPVIRSEREIKMAERQIMFDNPRYTSEDLKVVTKERPPTVLEVGKRLAITAPIAIAGSAAILWIARCTR